MGKGGVEEGREEGVEEGMEGDGEGGGRCLQAFAWQLRFSLWRDHCFSKWLLSTDSEGLLSYLLVLQRKGAPRVLSSEKNKIISHTGLPWPFGCHHSTHTRLFQRNHLHGISTFTS